LLGSPHSGKKCLAFKFVEGSFKGRRSDALSHALGDSCGSEVPIKEKAWGSSVFQIAIAWDNKDVTMCQYTDSHVVLICFDFTSRESYTEACMKWFREAKMYKCRKTIFLVGLKLDCTSNRMVTWDEVQTFCAENGIECFSCSASTGEGIEEIFHTACLLLKKLINEGEVEYICEYW
jgi:GTPase SAR1 family protein